MYSNEKIKKSWNSKKTREFVEIYLKNECLWNTENKDYKHRNIKKLAYDKLSNQFNLNSEEVKTKIRILRTTYKQEKNKMETTSGYYPKLAW